MNFIEELKWRGMMHQSTPDVEKHLSEGIRSGYIGFDPTAPSLTIGNFVQVQLLTLFQRSGHQPIALMGGATGRVGDPSGKDKERILKTYDELDSNLAFQVKQMEKFLDFGSGKTGAKLVNNYDFYKNMNVLDFLRDVGKTLTINYMTSKESVKKRVETGLSFTEFSYQLLQAYDFQCLFKDHGVTLQMGGSDQWGNITSGTEFIRKNLGEHAYAVTTPLLTKADGSKFGKSEQGNLWMDGNMTSPYKFYQFWINASDADLPKYIRYFTLKSRAEVEQMESDLADNPRELKKLLAEELTRRCHSNDDFDSVLKVSDLLFSNKASRDSLLSLNESALKTVAGEVDSFSIKKETLASGINIMDLLAAETTIASSKSDARRAIQGNSISVNKEKISDLDLSITPEHLLQGKYIMLEKGKKNKFMIEIS